MCRAWAWIFFGVSLVVFAKNMIADDELIAQVEGDLLKFESLSDIPEDYFVKVKVKWATTPDSALFYESTVDVERYVSSVRELEYVETVRQSKNLDEVPVLSGMQKNCKSIIGKYKARSWDGFLTNGKLQWFDQGRGENSEVPHECEFTREFDLPFVHRNIVIETAAPMRFKGVRCYWATDLGGEVVSLWTREDRKGTGFHELTFKKGLLVRHRILVTKRGIELKSKPQAKNGIPISDVKTTWDIVHDRNVPVKVEAVLNEANEVVLFEADLKWEFEKRFPQVVEERFSELKKLVEDK